MASRDAKCLFWVFPSMPTGSESIPILYAVLWHQGMQNVFSGHFLQCQLVLKVFQYSTPFYGIKGCKMSFLGISFNTNWFLKYSNTLCHSTVSRDAKCLFWGFPSMPTGSESIPILYAILWRQGMQNVFSGGFLQCQLVLKVFQYSTPFYGIKGCKMLFLGVSCIL